MVVVVVSGGQLVVAVVSGWYAGELVGGPVGCGGGHPRGVVTGFGRLVVGWLWEVLTGRSLCLSSSRHAVRVSSTSAGGWALDWETVAGASGGECSLGCCVRVALGFAMPGRAW